MNALCSVCPLYVFCEAFCPDADEGNRKLQREKYELSTENSRLRELAIENGLLSAAGERK